MVINPPPYTRKRFARKRATGDSGLTLIELITVIAVIAIISAMLIPFVGRIRESANQSKCASNLRQIGVALSLYQANNHGQFPAIVESWEDPKGLWFMQLDNYGLPFTPTIDVRKMKNQSHWYCPSCSDNLGLKAWGEPDYGANPFLFINRATTDGSPSGPESGKTLTHNSQVVNPASIIAVLDVGIAGDPLRAGWGNFNTTAFINNSIPATANQTTAAGVAFRHPRPKSPDASLSGSSFNALFADFHVEAIGHDDRRLKTREGREKLAHNPF